ncbi:MAG TPA: citrate/2-methylcitrate synthase [Candidatus Bathyarchaeia archaeon]|nr:citrate/2-methylcitrate synthase [Candidatus Bathyarchaeia archaeon]
MVKPDYVLFDKDTTAIVFGNQQAAVQRMLDFDYLSGRDKPSVAAVINPSGGSKELMKVFFGGREMVIPVYNNLGTAVEQHPEADVVINFASFRSAYSVSVESLEYPGIKTLVIIAEGLPERQTRELVALSKKRGKWIIGPATVGGFVPGAFKIGNAGGALSNLIMSKLYRSGSAGFVSKSGGMLNEVANMIALNSDGVYEGVAIGGDKYPGSTLVEHLLRYEANPNIKMMVVLGEVGGKDEYEIADALKDGKIKKPLIAWVTGTSAKIFPSEVQFGHAGAMARGEAETADAKNAALKEAGAIVPNSYDDFGDHIRDVYEDLKAKGVIEEKGEVTPQEIPVDYKPETMRRPANIMSTISDDRGEELLYAGVPISKVIREGYGVGDVISLLWFKKRLPKYVTDFLELALMITADHGPCVSGAHNAIVTAMAGKDLTAAVASGVLTIGPRFGGAMDGAAKYFKDALERGLTPRQFVDEMKDKNINIPGIGHRVKSVQNPDMRVKLLEEWAFANLPKHELLDYALEVEEITTAKRNNLILNVDGCVGIVFVDILRSAGIYTEEEIDEIINIGTLNGIFVLGRTIGMIGHYLDQNRLHSGLYRHPWDDVLYMLPNEREVLKHRKTE